MAVGRPVITTDNVGCRETVVFGSCGTKIELSDFSDVSEMATERLRSDVGSRMSDVDEGKQEDDRGGMKQGKNGFLVPVKDALSLARTMERFIHKPELAKEMGRESRRMAEERFDVHKINQQMMEILGVSGAA